MANYQQYGGNPYTSESGYGAGGGAGGNALGTSNPYGGTQLNTATPLQHATSNYSQASEYSQPPAAPISALPSHAGSATTYNASTAPPIPPQSSRAPPLNHKDFFARLDAIKAMIAQLTTSIQEIANTHQRMLSSPSAQSSAHLESLVTDAQTRNRQIKEQIQFLERDASREAASGNGLKRGQVDSVKRAFRAQLQDYQTEETDYAKRYREMIGRQYLIVNPGASDAEVREVQEADVGVEGIFAQALKSDRRGQADSVLSAVRTRHNDIQRITQTLGELAQLFEQLNEQVVYQEENIVHTEAATEGVVVDSGKAVKDLEDAGSIARRTRRLKWWTLLVVVIIIAILALALGIYFGAGPGRHR